jgi:hypothetical protein
MSEPNLQDFDDARLKAALGRALASERAPRSLRNRVEQMFAEPSERESATSFPARAFWRPSFRSMAAAAIVLICIGLAAWHFEEARQANLLAAGIPELPVTFAQDLIATHVRCCSEPDHHVLKGVPDDDFRLMTQKLREQLGFPALAIAAGDGWKFFGASASCMVGPAHSAHLVFKHDGAWLSIFSVAVASEKWPGGDLPHDGEEFANTLSGDRIISWVRDGTVYSVVGGSPREMPDFNQLTPIADQLRIALNDAVDVDRTTVASR